MNFKKYIVRLLVTLFFSVPSFSEKSVFFGKGEVVVSGVGSLWADIIIQGKKSISEVKF